MVKGWNLVVALLCLVGCSQGPSAYQDKFKSLDPDWTVTADEAVQWAMVKDANLPTLTGSPEWRNYLSFLEEKLVEYGAVDVTRNSWDFERWHTSNDATGWSLA